MRDYKKKNAGKKNPPFHTTSPMVPVPLPVGLMAWFVFFQTHVDVHRGV